MVFFFSQAASVLLILVILGGIVFKFFDTKTASSIAYYFAMIVGGLFQLQSCKLARIAFSKNEVFAGEKLTNQKFRNWLDFWATISIIINLLALLPSLFLFALGYWFAIEVKSDPRILLFSFGGLLACAGIFSSFIIATKMLRVSKYYWNKQS